MAKIIAPFYISQDRLEFRTRQAVRAVDWAELASVQHLLYARHGERISGIIWDTAFQTTSTTFVTVPTNSVRPLTAYTPGFRIHRASKTGVALFGVQVYGTDVEVEVTVTRWETPLSSAVFLVRSELGSPGWGEAVFELDPALYRKEDGTPATLYAQYKVRSILGDNVDMLQLDSYAAFIPADKLPTLPKDFSGVFATRTFTTTGLTGRLGPTQAQIDAAYASTALEDSVEIVGSGIQVWEVPRDGNFRIEAYGAGFNHTSYNRGAITRGTFALSKGDKLRILVGQRGNSSRCGDGGTFVTKEVASGGNIMFDAQRVLHLISAGASGGMPQTYTGGFTANLSGRVGFDGAGNDGSSSGSPSPGGTGGNGGGQGGTAWATSGAGFIGNGTAGDGTPAQSFINGGQGHLSSEGAPKAEGGFGGGGTGRRSTNWRLGGGGGYSGGASGGNLESDYGGGGGSLNAGTSPVNSATAHIGDGQVIIFEV